MAVTLTRTPSSNGNQKTWTFSCWIKRTGLGGSPTIIDGYYGNQSRYTTIYFDSNDNLDIFSGVYSTSSTSTLFQYTTTRKFRDTNGWYHLVIVCDTTQATAGDRIKLYVNGVRETSFGTETQPAQNGDSFMNLTNSPMRMGVNSLSAILSHVHYVDGTAYQASTFGSTDSTTGEWKINTSPSVTYGTNGFFIFKDSASVTDQSGNSNNLTVSSGTLTNTFDCPSNNFATLNKLYRTPYASSFTNGNTTATTGGAGNYYPCFSSIGVSTGKFYAEFKPGAGDFHIGISSQEDCDNSFILNDRYIGETSKSVGIASGNGSYYISGSPTSYGSSYSDTHIIGVALDMTNKKLYVSKDGTFYNSANPSSGTGGIDISGILSSGDHAFFAFTNYRGSGTGSCDVNFGNGYFGTTAITTNSGNGYAGAEGKSKFNYQPPTGFSALTTKGLNE